MSLYAREVEDTAETFRSVIEERDRLREQRDALVAELERTLWRESGVGAVTCAFCGAALKHEEHYKQCTPAAVLARIRAEGPEPGPRREELAEALERVTTDPEANDAQGGYGCFFCCFRDWSFTVPEKEHAPDCAWVAARSLLARMGRTVGG